MKIIIDSREQVPYHFEASSEKGALSIGDYSIQGLENYVSIERKKLDDLILCLSKDRARFERELYKGRSLDYMALIIEAGLADIIF